MRRTALALLALVALAGTAAAVEQVPLRRFALIAGSNDGGAGRVRLRYAATDAQAVGRVLREIGGVRDEDLVLLVDPDLAAFTAALERVRQAVSAPGPAGERREIVFYYSGHSDERGLILGSDVYAYDELRAALALARADVLVAILDSCASGALTRAKGGARRPAFLFSATQDMSGHAFLTSSSATEAAQESDRIGASFFTHYLVSALRGAADTTRDGLVTLNEAYAYTFQQTLASTENSLYGAQHPAYDISLTGSGDLVLTDIRSASSVLVVGEQISGRLYVRDGRGALAVELAKVGGQQVELGLEPGTYALMLDDRGTRSVGTISLSTGGRASVGPSTLRPADVERTTARGDSPLVHQAAHVGLLPAPSEWLFNSEAERNLSINILAGSSGALRGLEIGGLANFVAQNVEGVQAAGLGNAVRGDLHGLQMAGLVNWAGAARHGAAQVAGVANVTAGVMNGAQVAGAANYARQVFGPQISIVNVADTVLGMQIGVVNVARLVKGTQVGVLNFAEKVNGVALGVLTFEKRGRRSFELWGDFDGGVHMAFKLGARAFSTVFAAGCEPAADPLAWSYGVGLGGRIPVTRTYFVDVDAVLGSQHTGAGDWGAFGMGNLLPTLHVVAGWNVNTWVAVTAGFDADLYVPALSRNRDGSAVADVRLAPRIVIGLEF